MQIAVKEPVGLAWLKAAFSEQRSHIAALLRRLTGMHVSYELKPSTFRKFLMALEEIALEREIEDAIFSRIQEVETCHRLSRTSGKLKSATCDLNPATGDAELKASPDDWLSVEFVMALFSRRAPKFEE